jgi:hypothetical protein
MGAATSCVRAQPAADAGRRAKSAATQADPSLETVSHAAGAGRDSQAKPLSGPAAPARQSLFTSPFQAVAKRASGALPLRAPMPFAYTGCNVSLAVRYGQ